LGVLPLRTQLSTGPTRGGKVAGNLNKAVQRNAERFPADFMLTLTPEGQCAAVFRPTVLSRCRSAGLLAFDWNGAEIAKVYELRAL
jgi:hypothetical protein